MADPPEEVSAADRDDVPTADRDDLPAADPDDVPAADRGEEPAADRGEEPAADRGEEPAADRGEEPAADRGEEPAADRGEGPAADREGVSAAGRDEVAADRDVVPLVRAPGRAVVERLRAGRSAGSDDFGVPSEGFIRGEILLTGRREFMANTSYDPGWPCGASPAGGAGVSPGAG
ncbi:hypothetical protein GCM10027089_62050 [Nocardia thraciensis]